MLKLAEYLWLDGDHPTQQLRSKARVINVPDDRQPLVTDFPQWGDDGSSTYQADGRDSDLVLQPVNWVSDPLTGVRRLLVEGVGLDDSDYDGRTALHLAASEGQTQVGEFFIERGAHVTPIDRWGNTLLDDALRAGHDNIVQLLSTSVTSCDGQEVVS